MNEYERERQERIAKNAGRLQALGVDSLQPRPHGGRGSSGGGKRTRAREPVAGERRSSRLARLTAVDYSDPQHEPAAASDRRGPTLAGAHQRTLKGTTAPGEDLTTLPPVAVPQAVSASAELGTIRGTAAAPCSELAGWVGQHVLSSSNPPKASAVALATRGSPDAQPPRFSKYSGVAEMLDAIAVFVNLDKGSGDTYSNTFSHGGRRMSWFASSRMHEATPAIQRMLTTLPPTKASPEPSGRQERVLLFLREPGCYYMYAGEVKAAAWAPGTQPLQLEWELQDFAALTESQMFQQLLGPSLNPSEDPEAS